MRVESFFTEPVGDKTRFYSLAENNAAVQPGRLIYAEIVPLNVDLVQE